MARWKFKRDEEVKGNVLSDKLTSEEIDVKNKFFISTDASIFNI